MNYRQRLLVLGLLDATIVALSVLLVYALRFEIDDIPPEFARSLPLVTGLYVGLTLCAFYGCHLYNHVWQYASVRELSSIIKAIATSESAFYVLHRLLAGTPEAFLVPRSLYLFSGTLILLGVGGTRFAWRLYRQATWQKNRAQRRNVLVVGAGSAGALVVKELRSAETDLHPVAFIDDAPYKRQLEVEGIPVVGGREDIGVMVERLQIQEIVLALPSVSRAEIAKIINLCKTTKANIKTLPSLSDLICGKVSVKMIRDVSVEDLLGREQVSVDLGEIAGYVTDQVVLVTGAGGSIGSELCRQIARFAPKRLLVLGHGENSIYDIEMELRATHPSLTVQPLIADIQDQARIAGVFAAHRPSVIFHAAAHKHVPMMEINPGEAIKNNVVGTIHVAECADRSGVSHFVMISSDKAVNPTSVMGAAKRVAELYIQGLNRVSETKFVAVRFGNVLGSRGSVIPMFKRQILQGGPVTVTHPEMIRYFMTIPEAVQLVIQAGAFAQGGEVFILDMGKPVKVVDLARDLIRLSGLEPDVDIPIAYTGIRPGEKLFEELLTGEEGASATKHDRIFVGQATDFSREELQALIYEVQQTLEQTQGEQLAQAVRAWLKRVVPTYREVDPSGAVASAVASKAEPAEAVHTRATEEKETVVPGLTYAEV